MKELLEKIRTYNIGIKVEKGNLKLNVPNDADVSNILSEIKSNKEELIIYITNILNRNNKFNVIPRTPEKNNYPLSSAQKRLYLLQQFDLTSTAYNMPNIIPLGKEVDKGKIEKVFKQLINRHESFRTSIIIKDHKPIQIIDKDVEFELEEISIENTEVENIRNKFIKPFDLSKAPFLRVAIVDIKGENSLLMIDMHHIISDGTSYAILKKEFQALLSGEELVPLSLQYKDYSQWQNSKEQQELIKDQEQYWLNKFEREIPVLNLPMDYVRPSIQSHDGATVKFVLSKEETEGIRLFIKDNDLTLYMSLLSVFSILLSKLSGQDDIVVGTPIAGRNHVDLENIVGVFVNILSIRSEVKGEETIQDFVSSLKQTVIGAYKNQNYQFENLVDKLSVERDAGRNPIFDVVINLLNQAEYSGDISGFNNHEQVHEIGMSKFDLTLTAIDFEEQLLINFNYCTRLFKAETIDRFIVYFKKIVNQVAGNGEMQISNIEILSKEERHQLLYEFNNTEADYPKDKTIHQLFEEQVSKNPDRILVSSGDVCISYNELNISSNQLAWQLKELGVDVGDVIGLNTDRTEELLIGILGILKCGAAYLPLNSSWPNERINFMLSDSCCKILIHGESFNPDLDLECQYLDINNVESNRRKVENLEVEMSSSNILYIIYTSGTTGISKGVLTTHSNVSRVVLNTNYLSINKYDRILQLSSYSFDGSVFDIYGALLNGSSLVMLNNEDLLNIDQLLNIISKQQISIFFITTALFNTIVDYGMSKLKDVRKILFGGERISVKHTQKALEELGEGRLVHVYGPTETTVFASFHNINNIDEARETIPIGRPISNTTIYLLDKAQKNVPNGVSGEIYIGSCGNALGYLNNVELTLEKFIEHPYNEGERLYRTGDLARRLPDGNIEFLGRIDHQVKIRGFRIELGEIERTLLKHEKIKESVVLAIEKNSEKYLCAYIVSKEKLNYEEIRTYTSGKLPDYMIPSYFVQLKELPLTSNGKVNRKALPSPEIKAGDDYVEPSNEIEEKLVEIWSEVLNIEKEAISTTANFFSIGGHSLKATILTGKIYKEIGVEFPLRDVFLHSTIKSQASQIAKSTKKDFVSIPKTKEQSNYPLSPAQKRMYLLQQFDLTSTTYNMPNIISLGKEVDKGKIQDVFKQLINRHESFRTSINVVDQEPVQIINNVVDFEIEELSIEDTEVKNTRNNFIQPFDLSKAPFLRVAIVEIKGKDCMLMIDMHHIISDGISYAILKKEFKALLSGEELSPISLQYKDYSEWQNSKEQQELIKDQEEYWLTKFEGEIPVLNLPTDYVRPLIQSNEGATVKFVLSKDDTEEIRYFTKENDLTLYMSLLSVLSILLSKLSGQDDIVVGTPIAGRNHADLENIVGMFVNTLSIRNEVKGEETIRKFASSLKQTVLGAYENQNYQFEDLVNKVSVERNTSRNPIFDVMFNLLNQVEYSRDISGIDNENLVHTKGVSKFDMTITGADYGEQILFSFEYCTQLFKAETIDRFIVYFKQIVGQLARKPEIKISAIDILTEEEKYQLLYEFNNTKVDYPKDKTIHQLFEEQIEKTPDKIALLFENHEITYSELNIRSNQLARYLRSCGIQDNNIVGIVVDRSFDMIISVLGVLKAGGAYLPIDSEYPEKRIRYILKDSNISQLLTTDLYVSKFENANCNVISLSNINISLEEKRNLNRIDNSNNISYVIYTSGSTGMPKGIAIKHKSIINTLNWRKVQYNFDVTDEILQIPSFSFDSSVEDIFTPLSCGAKLILIQQDKRVNIDYLAHLLKRNLVTNFLITPSLYSLFLKELSEELKYVKTITIAGDNFTEELVNEHFEKFNNVELINEYGPTENSVCSTVYKFSNNKKRILIGCPIANVQVYILDEFNKNQPIGVSGELCLSGAGLGVGYLNNPELTSEKFIDNPFIEGDRLYKTGDLARWLADGNIEFLGRIDHQVKIRGFRIELGEIENVLQKHESIKESVVLAREENGDKYICAYVVCKEELSHEELRAYMSAQLPDYMIPSYFVQLDELPLTSNGKVNRKVLPSPEIKAGDDYVAPKTKEERLLVDIWSKVLGVEGIGVTDNFFRLGGDSIKTIQIQARLNTAGFKISVRDIFLNPIISDLATKMIFKANEVSQEAIIGDFKFTPIQYYFLSDETDQHHFNQSVILYSEEHLEEEKIQSVFRKLQEHHDALRITCKVDNSKKVTGLYNNGIKDFPVSLEVYDFRGQKEASEKITTYADQIQRSIDLENGSLMKLGLFHSSDGDRLLIVIHHLVIDGISWRIIFEDIETIFNQVNNGEKLSLPLKSNSFKDWSAKLTEYSKTSIFLKEKSYWRDIVSKEGFSLNRNIDNENIEDYDLGKMQFTLDQISTTDLLNNTNDVYGTEINDILLCGLGYGIKKTLGNEKVLISLEGHGREDIFSDLDISRTIGWFTTVYPVLLDMKHVDDLSLQIRSVKENLRQIPNKGIGFGILKYLTPSELKDDVNYDIEPEIEFNYLGQFDSDVDQMSLFKIAKESAGNTISPKRKNKYDFSIGGMIANGKLSVNITYKKKYYSDEIIINLLENYKKSLLEIINHCTKLTDKILTPSDFTYKDLSIKELDKLVKQYEIEDIYKLTPMQEGMLFHAMHDSESFAYFEQMNYRLQSELSVNLMRKSLNKLFSRHDILRTVFIYEEMQIPLQLVLKDRACEFDFKDIRDLRTEEKKQYILNYKKIDRERGFRLDQDVLMRVSLIQLNNNEYELIWSNHHILMDGWCMSIINNDFFEIYNSLLNNRTLKLNSVTPYKEYVKWLDKIDKNSSLKYWKDYLSGYEEQALLPNLSKKGYEFVQQKEHLQLSKELTAKFQKIASDNNVTANIILQTVWAIVLGKYSNKEDIVFGSVVSGRPSEIYGVESMVGLFINNVPVRIQFSEDLEFSTLIKRVQNSNLESETHHYISLAEIQSQSLLKQNLIDHIIVFENFPIAKKIESLDHDNKQLSIQISGVDTFEQTNYNLTINASMSDVLHVKFIYNANMFDSDMMKSLKMHFESVVNDIISDSEIRISAIDILTEEEKLQLLYEFNNTEADYLKDKTIHQLFEEQCTRTPNNIALIFEDTKLSYLELDQRSNQIAHFLIIRGSQVNSLVGIIADRSIDLVVGILGILKAGCGYLPIDTKSPNKRIEYILRDSCIDILLTQNKYSEFESFNLNVLYLDKYEGFLQSRPTVKEKSLKPEIAYLIYTSGSTGLPKGILVENSSVVNLLCFLNTKYSIEQQNTWLFKTPYIFDVSVSEIFGWILPGGRLSILPPEGEKNPELILHYISLHQVTHINFVPSMFGVFVYYINNKTSNNLKMLRYIILAGEALKSEHVELFSELAPNIKLENLYGPTETTVFSSFYSINKENISNNISIGHGVSNTNLYVLNSLNQLQGIGIPGELHIAGEGLSLGYLNQIELVHDRFIPNPYEDGELLYKTGDLVRWLKNGTLEYLGRIDHQVKIRGNRIELGEIENALLKYSSILECTVMDREDSGEKYLCAYLVIEENFNKEEIRNYLSASLPDYMIPSYFVQLDELPLTSNGKVNRKALPSPQIKAGDDYVAPSNETEEKLVKIWSEVLNVPQEDISTTVSFFAIGGHSLKATILVSKIHKELSVKLPLKEIFQQQTIKNMAVCISEVSKVNYSSIKLAEKKEYYALSSAQKRLYFIQQMDFQSLSYNMPMAIPLGVDIKIDSLENTFVDLVSRHESFRTSFITLNNEPVQRIYDKVDFKLDKKETTRENLEKHIKEYIRPFDLSKDIFIRACLMHVSNEQNVLVVDMHHIISDGTTSNIVREDFLKLLSGEKIAPLKLQYKDFSNWQNTLIEKGELKSQESYWKDLFSGDIPVLNLQTDYKRPESFTFKGDVCRFSLDEDETALLRDLGKGTGSTLYMNILALLNTLFYRFSNQEDIIIGSGIAGRQHSDLQGISGMFVNTLAMRNYPNGDKTYLDFLKEVSDNSIAAFENQDIQFEDLVDMLNIDRDISRNPLFDISMLVQNFGEISQEHETEKEIQTEDHFQKSIAIDGTTKCDMTFFITETSKIINISIEYYSDIFRRETIEEYIKCFRYIVKSVIKNPEIKLKDIDLLSEEEKHKLLYQFNNTQSDYPKNKTIHEIFEEQVDKSPEKIALVCESEQITYKELEERSNQVAHYLRLECGVSTNECIGIYMDNGAKLIVSILGVLKSGCAYLPLPVSGSHPEERVRYMINDASLRVIISEKQYLKEMNKFQWECPSLSTYLCLDSYNISNESEVKSGVNNRALWEYIGEESVDEVTGGGWTSSYTGQPIPHVEMDEFGKNILKKLEPHINSQTRILEIGCASGITMFRLAPLVELYYGTDLSGTILKKNEKRILAEGHDNIIQKRLSADEIDRLEVKDFDLIIINSVIQGFDGHNYLKSVIRKVIGLLKPKGLLFLGDIMDLDLKKDLVKEVKEFKRLNTNSEYNSKTEWNEELFLSRKFWDDLKSEEGSIKSTEYSRKIHTIENELTKFRYDVLISIDKNQAENIPVKQKNKHQHDLNILENYPIHRLSNINSSESLVNIIYTSGSTGKPKGVQVKNLGIVNYIMWRLHNYSFTSQDITLQLLSNQFDGFGSNLYSSLLSGGTLVLISEENRLNIKFIKEVLKNKNITNFSVTPGIYSAILDEIKTENNLDTLRFVVLAGEKANYGTIDKSQSKLPNVLLYNEYGPTEASVAITCNKGLDSINLGLIGKPISNTKIYILGESNNMSPILSSGELCVSGDGLAFGYLNNPELTKKKFIEHPFIEGEKLYRTGDLARWLSDGNIEFLGRIDHQVKIRGFRIELGEIEDILLKHENIKECVVTAIEENNEKSICAYVVCKVEFSHKELRAYMSAQLPDYMVPQHFVELESLPLTSNGKLNRKALPSLEVKAGDDYVSPKTKEESLLVDVWSKVLGVKGIGVNDNFFSLGGDSIKTIQIQARLNTAGFKISVKDIFLHPIISDLASKMIFKANEVSQEVIIGDFKLSPIQYFFLSDETEQHHFNQSVMLYSEEYLEEEKIQSVFRKLQEHHDALRITCKVDNAKKVSGLYNNGIKDFPVSLEVHDFREEKEATEKITSYADQIQRSIDLENGPLLKLGLFHLPDGDRLLIVIHHLVIDGVSWRIIFEDIEKLFNQINKVEKLSLPVKSNSFRDWSAKLTEYSKTSIFLKEKSYWRDIVSKEEFSLNRQINDENIEDNDVGYTQFMLDEIETSDLLNNTNEVYGTEINDILLCGLGYGVKKTFGNEKVLISLEGHGREDIFSELDISRTIGWFTTVYPVLLDMKNVDDLSLQIRSVKEKLRQIPNKGIGFGILKYLTPPELKDNVNYDIEPQIEFNYLGQFDSDVDQMSLFKIAKESAGNTISLKRKNKCDFSIGGMIANGKLSITFTYKKKYYSEELIDNLLENYKKSLLEILNHCAKLTDKVLTPSDFTYKDLSITQVDKLVKQYEIEDIYKLTPMQEGMLFQAMHDSESLAYFEQINYRIESELSVELMRKSLNELFSRYDILRTVFIYKDIQIPLQLVLKERECEFDYKDIRALSTEEKKQYILNYKKTDRERGFRLDQDILMRVSFIQIDNNEYELIWSNHHILMDGWCISIINNDFFEIYNSLLNNRTLKLNSITPFKEYVKWLDGIDKNTSLKYWKEYLSGYEENASLPILLKNGNKFVQQREHLQLSKEVSAKFQKVASDNNVTANIILQSVWAIVLGKYSNKEDIVFGSVVSGRPSEIYGVESMVGLFINNVPIRIQFSQDIEFSTLIKRVQNSNLDSESHHYISLAEIQAQSILKQNLINHIIVFENYPVAEKMESLNQDNEQLNIQISGVDNFEQTIYNLAIKASLSDILLVDFIYNANMFDADIMKSLKVHFENVINHIVSDSEVKISAIDILTEEEKHQLLYEFNNTKADYPKDKTIHQLFEEQVELNPDKLALECKNKTFTYQKLNEESNQIAHYLIEKGLKREDIVGIELESSCQYVVSIFAVLKAGGAFLPIDKKLPDLRKEYIVENSELKILIHNDNNYEKNAPENIESINMQILDVQNYPLTNPSVEINSSNLAYVIYTSGSTGKPKGTLLEHKGIVSENIFWKEGFKIRPTDRCLQFSNISFDASVAEIYSCLFNGASLYIPDENIKKDIGLFEEYLVKNQITVATFPPPFADNLNESTFKNFRLVITAGSETNSKLIEKISKYTRCINAYGPTETSICATYWDTSEYNKVGKICIGRPIQNIKAYIIDSHMQLQGIGISGELCFSGEGLARAYLKNPELTAEKFITHPFKEGERLYRTGDLARWLPDGNIEFLGRIDHQVKIRGFRIELGEIENVLLKHANIKESVVLAREENGDKYLCAYVVCKEEFSHEELRAYMSEQLPEYMVPSYFVELDKLPLTSNGKVNRKALPSLQIKAGDDYVAPSNEIEEKLVEIWSEVLNIEKEEISVIANFFTLGGHSLKATILISKINNEFNVKVPLAEIFKSPTIRILSKYIINIEKDSLDIQDESLVLLKKGNNKENNLFLIHAGSGEVDGYIKFCSMLNDGYNYWGIRTARIKNYSPINITIEEIANKYIEKIKIIQPEGPYYIAGWCIGGTIAFEMLKQLEQKDEEVNFFALINTSPPVINNSQILPIFSANTELEIISESKLINDESIMEKINNLRSTDQIWPVAIDYIESNMTNPDIIRKLIPESMVDAIPDLENLNIQDLIYYFNTVRSYDRARNAFVPETKNRTFVNFFSANKAEIKNRTDWNKFCHQPVKFHKVTGDHFSIFKNPEVVEFVKIFDEAIRDSN